MKNNNIQVLETLQHEYHKKTDYYSYTDLPEEAVFEIDGVNVKYTYTSNLILKKLNNKDSFEGWAIALRRWGVYDNIIFKWDIPSDTQTKEYQKFLFRVKTFLKYFYSWFSVCKENLKQLEIIDPKIYVCEKLILESIIDICWYFETTNKIDIVISDRYTTSFIKDGVNIQDDLEETTDAKEDKRDYESNKEDKKQNPYPEIDIPWQLIIERWAYLPCSPKQDQLTFTNMEKLPHDVVELIKVGFAERNFPYPSEY
ncbi:MAG: hypothetical protein Q4F97_03665 [Bacteroidales bacterium]|nr:hypothetical protein [Bacteroidales bacterium]